MHTKCESCKVSLIMEDFSVYDKGYGKNTLMLSFAFPLFNFFLILLQWVLSYIEMNQPWINTRENHLCFITQMPLPHLADTNHVHLYLFIYLFLTSPHVGSQLPDQGLNPHPLHQKHRVLTLGCQGSPCFCFCCCSDSMSCSTPGFSVLHHLPEFAHTHVHRVSDVIQSSHFLSCPQSFPASGSSKVLELPALLLVREFLLFL